MPTKIVYGQGSIKNINDYIKGRKVLLVTSSGFVKRGVINKIEKTTNNIVFVVSSIQSHPQFKDLKKIYKQISKIDFELILAIGGGSVIDSAKFLSVRNNDKDYNFVEDIIKKGGTQENYQLTPVIAIPTTAGTGSEITPYSTIWDKQEKKKYSLNLPDLFCEAAIYDPVLTLTVPRDITIQTGLDSLSHALESIWNKNANPITINYAIKAATLIINNLVNLANNLGNLERRDDIMRACMYAGLSFSNTQTAMAHAISYYVTLHKDVPHGIACSFILPILIDNVIGKYNFIDKALIEIFGELSSNKLRCILKKLDISSELGDYGIDGKELNKLREFLRDNQRARNSLVDF